MQIQSKERNYFSFSFPFVFFLSHFASIYSQIKCNVLSIGPSWLDKREIFRKLMKYVELIYGNSCFGARHRRGRTGNLENMLRTRIRLNHCYWEHRSAVFFFLWAGTKRPRHIDFGNIDCFQHNDSESTKQDITSRRSTRTIKIPSHHEQDYNNCFQIKITNDSSEWHPGE